MKWKAIVLSVFVSFGCLPVSGQNAAIDSLRQEFKKAKQVPQQLRLLGLLSENLLEANPDSALRYAEKQLELSKKSGDELDFARALFSKGTVIARKGNDTLAISIFQEAQKLRIPSSEIRLKANLDKNIGRAYYHLALYDKAIEAFFNALDFLQADSLKTERAAVLNSIGNVFYFTNMSEAAKYYQQSLEIHQSTNNLDGIASQLGNLGLVYINMKDFDKGIEYSKQSLNYYKQLGYERSIARSEVNLAHAYKEVNQSGLALVHAQEALRITEKLNDARGIATATIMLGNIYFDLNDFGAAVRYYEPGIEMVRTLGMRSYEWEAMFFLAESYAKLGKTDKALELYPKVINLRDSINKAEMQSMLAEKDAQYQTLQKEGQIQLLTAEAEVAELELRKGETYLFAATIITFLLGIVSLVVFFFYRIRTKANVALERKNNEISHQKEIIEEKNLHITDSIRYAQRLQAAILPKAEMFEKHFSAHTILYKPKDIVSGDFYWMENLPPTPSQGGGAICYLAVADCTGHGVPGAMVSMVGFQGLNKAVLEEKLTSPAAILQRLSDYVEEAFEKSGGSVKDGMDICLVAIDTKKRTVAYAGAHNPLWILTSKEDLPNANLREEENGMRMFELKADRRSIGGFMDAGSFTETVVKLNEGDHLFLFTDGFADQFGGPEGKKLGSKRLRETARQLALSGNLTALGAIFQDWKGDEEQVDDVSVISVAL
ncbi:MAG: tetratricopeptide repeat protein [Flavobacteriales bacterium]|nr:tetratricopeptide repeat protein [Flavobacteriales bacterium]